MNLPRRSLRTRHTPVGRASRPMQTTRSHCCPPSTLPCPGTKWILEHRWNASNIGLCMDATHFERNAEAWHPSIGFAAGCRGKASHQPPVQNFEWEPHMKSQYAIVSTPRGLASISACLVVGLLTMGLSRGSLSARPARLDATGSSSPITLRSLAHVVSANSSSIPEPVTSHPRLWITKTELPQLRSWAVPSNPTYEEGMGPLLQHVLSVYNTDFSPFYTANPPHTPYPIRAIPRDTPAIFRRNTDSFLPLTPS